MSAGTLTITNNATYVVGQGTSFVTELAAGDFILVTVGGIPYTLPVKSMENNTWLTLVSNFTGPTQAGAAWSAIPRVALNMVTAALVAQSAEALRGLNYDKQNWQQLFSGTGDVTVKLPDGSSFTGPAWGGITTTLNGINQSLSGKADKTDLKSYAKKGENSDITSLTGMTTPLSVLQGGSGANNADGARSNLQAASIWNSWSSNIINKNIQSYPPRTGYWQAVNNQWTPAQYGGVLCFNNSGNEKNDFSEGQVSRWMFISDDNKIYLRMTYTASGNTVDTPWVKQWGQANTTIDANGALKPASPIVKVFGDGSVILNDESEGVTVARTGPGEYLISGVMGLNSDPEWGGIEGGIVIPVNINNQPLIWADYSVKSDGSILLKTYHRTHPDAPAFTQNRIGVKDKDGNFTEIVKDGEPVDIPSDRWVDLRVQMPADSIWNRAQEAIRIAMEEAASKSPKAQPDIHP